MALLELDALSKTYPGPVLGLDQFSLEVNAGEHLALLGHSGSGKSTLLRLIAGLDSATSGRIRLAGRDLSALPADQRGVGLLTQRPVLYPQLTVRRNLDVAGPTFPSQAIEWLRISKLLDRYPHQLSGGELQRVALARLLTRPTQLWLLDEPFNGLDLALRQEFRLDLLLLNSASSATMVIVTHDPADALALGRQIGVLGNGRLLQVGPADVLSENPQHLSVWQSLGLGTLLGGHAVGGEQPEFHSDCGAITTQLPDFLRCREHRPSHLTLGIRPEELLVESPSNPPPSMLGTWFRGWPLILVEPVGRGRYLTLARAATRIRVYDPSHAPLPVGRTLNWFLPRFAGTWFDTLSGSRLQPEPPLN